MNKTPNFATTLFRIPIKPDDNCDGYISAINFIALKAYKKKSRIFKAICDSLGVSDNSAGSDFQKLFAQLADEISSKKLTSKFFSASTPLTFLLCLILSKISADPLWLAVILSILPNTPTTVVAVDTPAIIILSLFSLSLILLILDSFDNFAVGTYGLCIACADVINSGLYCDCCNDKSHEICDDCGENCDEIFLVYNRRGDTIYVCSDCRDANYRYCDFCEEYYPRDQMTYTGDDEYICENCLYEHFFCCDICHEYFHEFGCYDAIDSDGYEITVCEFCRDRHTHTFNNCGRNFQFRFNFDSFCHSCQNHVEEVDNHDAA